MIHVRPAVLLAAWPEMWLNRFVLAPADEQPRRPIVLGNRRRRSDRVIRLSERRAAA